MNSRHAKIRFTIKVEKNGKLPCLGVLVNCRWNCTQRTRFTVKLSIQTNTSTPYTHISKMSKDKCERNVEKTKSGSNPEAQKICITWKFAIISNTYMSLKMLHYWIFVIVHYSSMGSTVTNDRFALTLCQIQKRNVYIYSICPLCPLQNVCELYIVNTLSSNIQMALVLNRLEFWEIAFLAEQMILILNGWFQNFPSQQYIPILQYTRIANILRMVHWGNYLQYLRPY